MKERPILFSTPMVQAILAGRKTQTRRIAKGLPTTDIIRMGLHPDGIQYLTGQRSQWKIECPYGQPGDRLWVRETWRIGAWNDFAGTVAVDYRADNSSRREWIEVRDDDAFTRLHVQSVEDAQFKQGHKENYKWKPGQSPCRWRSSLHMRREFSRITLEITGVRAQRLKDINYRDCKAEGLDEPRQFAQYGLRSNDRDELFRISYKNLWVSINGKGSWDANPWVWVVEFKRTEKV